MTFVNNRSPALNEYGVASNTRIYFDLLSSDPLKLNTVDIYINEDQAFNGSSYVSPYNTVTSDAYATNVDGYDGYHFRIDSYGTYDNITKVRLTGTDAYGSSYELAWGFIVGTVVNKLYFSDGYGIKTINIQELVGESQDGVYTIASTSIAPNTGANNATSLFGKMISNISYLCASYSNNAVGCDIITNEGTITRYSDGYKTDKAQLNDRGILYLINKDNNTIEVYYGAHARDGYGRTPDFEYSSSSTPSIVAGDILELYIVSGESTKYSGGTRLFIGTTQGATRVETYDSNNGNYSNGYDGYGVSVHYGISGSGLQHEIIGGTVSRVVSMSTDASENVLFVVTNDGAGNGGVTQISILENRGIVFMTQGSGVLPTNDVRDIYGRLDD